MSRAWIEFALCGEFANLPWLDDNRSSAATYAMTAVCHACPVLDDCRRFADEHAVTAGFWAAENRTVNAWIGGEAA